jgi:hypothetical protein
VVRKTVARLVIRNQNHPLTRAARSALKSLGLTGVARLLFAGDLAQRPLRPAGDPRDPVAWVYGRLELIANSSKPVVVGPWVSEVGFELLYWIPFLHWAVRHFGIAPERITVVSRGGARCWYGALAANYVDIFDHFTPEEFRTENEIRRLANGGLQKHTAFSGFDRSILDRIGISQEAVALLHPELMYLLFDDFWQGAAGMERVADHVDFVELAPPSYAVEDMPPNYIAVKFYDRPSFPMTEENRALIGSLTTKLADQRPVVFLSSSIGADEHRDFSAPVDPRVTAFNAAHPGDNLLVQSAIISRAKKVFCTYGGFSYLPLFYRVPAVGLYSADQHFFGVHGPVVNLLADRMATSLTIAHAESGADLMV